MRHAFQRVALSLVGVIVLGFTADYLSIRFAIPSRRAQFDSVTVQRMYAVKLKDKRTSYIMDKAQNVECVNSLFPHFGDPPCWYLRRHTEVEVDLDSGPAGPLFDTP